MTFHTRAAATRLAAGAIGLFAACAMAGFPAYADDGTPHAEPPASGEGPGTGGTPSPSPTEPAADPTASPSPTADPDDPSTKLGDVSVAVPGPQVTVGSDGKWVRVDVDNNDSWSKAENVQVTVETADLDDTVEVELADNDDCDVDGGTGVCRRPTIAANGAWSYPAFKITPKTDAEGTAGVVHVSVRADGADGNLENNQADVEIELLGSGPDLTRSPLWSVR